MSSQNIQNYGLTIRLERRQNAAHRQEQRVLDEGGQAVDRRGGGADQGASDKRKQDG